MTKGSIQLSIGMLVTIIIGIVMLVLGIVFLRQIIGGAEELREDLDEQTEAQLIALLDQGQQVALPFNTQTIKRGGSYIFGVAVVNILNNDKPSTFRVAITPGVAVDKAKKEFSPAELQNVDRQSWVRHDALPFQLSKNDRQRLSIRIAVPSNAPQGMYTFNVEVCAQAAKGATGTPCSIKDATGMLRYDTVKKIYVTVP